jgi:hypothetical protein
MVGCSPGMPCYYRNQQVINAALGQAIGGTAGAIGGGILGTATGLAVLAAFGCGLTLVFAPICLLALFIACAVAAAITAGVSFVGAAAGNTIGNAVSGGSPSGLGPPLPITVGAYVMVIGNLIRDPDNANAIWFAGWIPDPATETVNDETQATSSGTTVLGQSSGLPPFCFTDPEANIVGDPCQPAPSEGAPAS